MIFDFIADRLAVAKTGGDGMDPDHDYAVRHRAG